MSTFIRKSHNVSVLLYHLVCGSITWSVAPSPGLWLHHLVCGSKYRRAVFNAAVAPVLKDVCLEISVRYETV